MYQMVQSLYHSTFLPAKHEVFSFSMLSIIHFFFFFTIAILVGMKWHLTVNLICISLMTNDTKHIFYMLVGHLQIFSREMSIPILYSFQNWNAILYLLQVFIIYAGYKSLIRYIIYKYFLILWVIFSLSCVLQSTIFFLISMKSYLSFIYIFLLLLLIVIFPR